MIALASDHAGYVLKEVVKKHFDEKGIAYKDFGTNTTESTDYALYAVPACKSIVAGECELGILICGTGIGMSMTANKMHGIRAAACSDYFSAKATRQHNNANVLCMGERVIGPGLMLELVDVFLNTEFEGGRHQRRIDQIMAVEEDN